MVFVQDGIQAGEQETLLALFDIQDKYHSTQFWGKVWSFVTLHRYFSSLLRLSKESILDG